ncbi:MAG: hypothetical protein HZR80_13425 [Candidatus Heimdallarchaeota archaeon]
MKSLKKSLIGISLISLFLLSAGSQLTARSEGVTISENLGAITVQTNGLTVKIIPSQGHLMWWHGNKSDADEMYKLQLVKIQEYFGDDDILDDRTELVGGKFYNLITEDWVSNVNDTDPDHVIITLSLLGLAGGADIHLVMHIYTEDTLIEGTEVMIDATHEIKFDIIINNWEFSAGAQGIGIQSYLDEVQKRHTMRLRNGTSLENGTLLRRMNFESDEFDGNVVAFYEWTQTADVFDENDTYVETVDVGTAYFDDLITAPPTGAAGNKEGLGHLWLTYPNYGNESKLVHDPIIGVNEEYFTESVPLYYASIIGGLIVLGTIVVIARRRK